MASGLSESPRATTTYGVVTRVTSEESAGSLRALERLVKMPPKAAEAYDERAERG